MALALTEALALLATDRGSRHSGGAETRDRHDTQNERTNDTNNLRNSQK